MQELKRRAIAHWIVECDFMVVKKGPEDPAHE
jgi:hypothetical protein